MKTNKLKILILPFLKGFLLLFFVLSLISMKKPVINSFIAQLIADSLKLNRPVKLKIDFRAGTSHLNPVIAFWIEDTTGKFLQTIFVSKTVATSTYDAAKKVEHRWISGIARHPATLPYWAHKRGIRADDGYYIPSPDAPIPDAYSGATPVGNFRLYSTINDTTLVKFVIKMEINQPEDLNKYFDKKLFPEDEEYRHSGQPALIYSATIDLKNNHTEYTMKPIGHSHPSGTSGELFYDLENFTTALQIVDEVVISWQQL